MHGKLITARELKEILGIPISTIYRMAADRRIPFYAVGRAGVRFDAEEVRESLRRPATPESRVA